MKPTILTFVLFIIILVSLREIMIRFFNVNCYALLFFLIFGLVYYSTKNYGFSLFISLIVVFFRTIYRYICDCTDTTNNFILFTVYLCFVYYIITSKVSEKDMSLPNFILFNYAFISINEYFIHRYITHSKEGDWITRLPFFGDFVTYMSASHVQHHKEVNPDMTMDNVSDESSLYFDWSVYFRFSVMLFFLILLSRYISNYDISIKYIVLITLTLTFIHVYLWNKIHKSMHDVDINFSIYDGPYDNNLFDLTFVKNLLYENHRIHHLKKGDTKGNYNIIFLGADEWFGSNNKTADNTEYCKTHMDEPICQNG